METYSKHNFESGDILEALQLNQMDSQIEDLTNVVLEQNSTILQTQTNITTLTTNQQLYVLKSEYDSTIAQLTERINQLESYHASSEVPEDN